MLSAVGISSGGLNSLFDRSVDILCDVGTAGSLRCHEPKDSLPTAAGGNLASYVTVEGTYLTVPGVM